MACSRFRRAARPCPRARARRANRRSGGAWARAAGQTSAGARGREPPDGSDPLYRGSNVGRLQLMSMNPVMAPEKAPEKQRSSVSNLIAGALGGLIVLVVGAVLIATDVIDTGDSRTVVRQPAISQPASDPAATDGGRTVQDIYREEGDGVVFIESEGVSSDSIFGQSEGTATGSGFVVDDDGTIVTNAHVVEGAERRDRALRGERRGHRRRGEGRRRRHRPGGAEDRPERGRGPPGDPAGRLLEVRGRRPRGGHRQPLRPRSGRSPPASCPRCSARSRRPAASRSPT